MSIDENERRKKIYRCKPSLIVKNKLRRFRDKVKMMKRLLNLLWPEKCIGCEKAAGLNKYGFCSMCMSQIIFLQNRNQSYLRHIARYNGPMKKAICAFKYKRRKFYGKKFAALTLDFLKRNDFPEFETIIPVPIYWKKEFTRGFNQSALISAYLSKWLNKELLLGNLVKIKNTHSQTELDENRRKESVKDSFTVKKPASIKEKKILLIDDVYTTGATAQEASRILKKNKAKKVVILTIAR